MKKENLKPSIIACIVVMIIIIVEFGYVALRDDNKAMGNVSGKVLTELPICPKCLEAGCIYEDIDSMSDGTDQSIFNAIMYIAKERKLTEKQIELLLTEYYL